MEVALVRACAQAPHRFMPHEENVLRTALSLARMYAIQHQGQTFDVGTFLNPFREEVERLLNPVLGTSVSPPREALQRQIGPLREKTVRTYLELKRYFQHQFPEEALDHELRHKSLVLVLGGGGGTGYVYVGVMALLEDLGLRPSLMVGTSIGAILALFRSRLQHFEKTELINIVRGLSWKKLFRMLSMESRYGLPAPLRLYLRAGIGRFFESSEGHPGSMNLSELPVPIIVSVSGIRKGMLPHPVEFYENLITLTPQSVPSPLHLAHGLWKAFQAIRELTSLKDVLVPLHLGAEHWTQEFDALDATGFSSSLPGVIHYDILREDERMHQLLAQFMSQHDVARLVDGGLTNNLPAEAAWKAVCEGKIGTRNAFILALNGFSLRLSTPLWAPLQQLAEWTVTRNRPYAHLTKDFKRTLSPLELVPTVDTLNQAISLGRDQMMQEVPFLSRMFTPLERLDLP